MINVCDKCGVNFKCDSSKRKFCSLKCCWEWRRENKDKVAGAFKPGIVPWNTGTVGVMKPNSGTFQVGRDNGKWLPIGAVTIRADKNSGERAWVKVTDNGDPYDWKLRAVVNWEEVNGPVPAGYVVHHRDRNKLNDDISNLELQTRADHLREHRAEHNDKRLAGLRNRKK